MQVRALTFCEVFRPKAHVSAIAYDLVVILAGSVLLALSAQVSFWIGPVPVTGQTFAVLMLAAMMGPYRSTAAVLMYLAQGAAGLPVGASGAFGAAWLFGPTAGYLFGFIPASCIVGYLAQRRWDRGIMTTIAAMVMGNACIYVCGLAWLTFMVDNTLKIGLYPFLIGDVVKIVLAAVMLPTVWKTVKQS